VIIETLISTYNQNGMANFTPIGVHCRSSAEKTGGEFQFYLYRGTQIRANLLHKGCGAVNFSDDAALFVEAALFHAALPAAACRKIEAPRLNSAILCWEFEVAHFDDTIEPANIRAKILHVEDAQRHFTGFCRAHYAIIEAAIGATRLAYLPQETLAADFLRWQSLIKKTGGEAELAAWRRICTYLQAQGWEIAADEGIYGGS
jgi:hypothetical protein